MSTLALAHAFDTVTAVDDSVSLLGLPTARSAKKRLSGTADEVVKTIAAILDEMVLDVIEKRTAAEFEAAADAAFPRYVRLVLSFSQIVATIVPEQDLARVTSESLCELEADLRENALQCFGADIRDRAIFTVWTLHKISDLLEVLAKSQRVADGQREKDHEFATHFLHHALRARFNIDCLTASMRTHRSIYPETLPKINDGLRSAVNAYAWIKQAVDLRHPTDESESLQPYWSSEDKQLVDESMKELAQEDATLSSEDVW